MAFTGTAVVKQITDRIVRITGLSLASGATGTIGLTGKTVPPDVTLPEQFMPTPSAYGAATAQLQDLVQLEAIPTGTNVAVTIPISVVKTGTTPADFQMAVTNTHGTLSTPTLEFYVKNHD